MLTRVQCQGLGVIVYGGGVVLLAYAADGTQIVQHVDIRIQSQCFRGIGLGTHKVVKVKFSHTAHLPGAIEVWLQLDGLIEVLYAEHIVFIVEGYFSTANQPVNLILRTCLQREQGEKKKTIVRLSIKISFCSRSGTDLRSLP